mmetsp:Transcript_2856/g.4459  ORF Transcript_2856/g.4459 Transcript_2856/m.4459 type:complete len:220 (+) Transcript_2856:1978-2637(+)
MLVPMECPPDPTEAALPGNEYIPGYIPPPPACCCCCCCAAIAWAFSLNCICSIIGFTSGVRSRRHCDAFSLAFRSPTSNQQFPSALTDPAPFFMTSPVLVKNRPGGVNPLQIFTTSRATLGLSTFEAAKYRNLCSFTSCRNFTLPEWLFVPPPRPSSTSCSVGFVMISFPGGKSFAEASLSSLSEVSFFFVVDDGTLSTEDSFLIVFLDIFSIFIVSFS